MIWTLSNVMVNMADGLAQAAIDSGLLVLDQAPAS